LCIFAGIGLTTGGSRSSASLSRQEFLGFTSSSYDFDLVALKAHQDNSLGCKAQDHLEKGVSAEGAGGKMRV
jgi:hypothetical protein